MTFLAVALAAVLLVALGVIVVREPTRRVVRRVVTEAPPRRVSDDRGLQRERIRLLQVIGGPGEILVRTLAARGRE